MVMVAVGQVSVMSCQFVFASLVVLSCFLMVPRRVFVMLGRLVMMFRCLLGHNIPPMQCRGRI